MRYKENYNMKNIHPIVRLTIAWCLVIFTIIVTTYPATDSEGFIHDRTSNNTEDSELIKQKSKLLVQSVIDKVNLFSFEYQNKFLHWQNNTNDNKTIIKETRDHIKNLEDAIVYSKNFTLSDNYKPVIAMYTKSLQSEIDSYEYFVKAISALNNTEKKIFMDTSDELLSSALTQEMQALSEFKKTSSE